jgi:hypothetical protein
MRRGIVITTSEHTKDWLKDCLDSIPRGLCPVVVGNGGYFPEIADQIVVNHWNGFELGGILRGKEIFDEFIHLMDSTIIKDHALFDKLFEIPGHVFLTQGGYHYMGKFVSNDLPEIPIITTKEEAIAHELHWLGGKARTYFNPDLPAHTGIFEEKHGRQNMVLENEYLIKYKATYRV